MRQPQHRNRARMRTRRQPNPVNKVYESNGPDVKVRGTPQQIVDKYMQLGRDALSSGDAVKAENYFQHAEHYLRIISAAQEQMQARRQQQEQRKQEAAERRKGNGSARPETDATEAAVDPASQPQPEVAEVVVLPTEANAETAAEAAGESAPAESAGDEAPAWEGEPPSFLARPVNAGDAAAEEAADAAAAEDAAAAPRKTTRRRRTTRTTRAKKGNGDAAKAAGESSEVADDQPPAADNA